MQPTSKPHVKICCISSIEEARMAVRYGASAVGLVSEMPSGPGPIPESLIAEIVPTVPPHIKTFLLTSKRDAATIIGQQRHTKVNTLQLVDAVALDVYLELRHQLPSVSLVQVIHVTGEESIDEAKSVAPYVDALLLDSGNPTLPTKELGGTGRTHNWGISRKIREEVSLPIYLAGGLRPENVAEAIARVSPYAVDVCRGLRTDGKLDEKKLARFMDAVMRRI
ncbi:MAG: phosphoribosylanthranilate isomerase [Ignavibacteriales bacterium]|nr:phosphoribosylanthranilate isomerase [Ignavibacteriales bacterium]